MTTTSTLAMWAKLRGCSVDVLPWTSWHVEEEREWRMYDQQTQSNEPHRPRSNQLTYCSSTLHRQSATHRTVTHWRSSCSQRRRKIFCKVLTLSHKSVLKSPKSSINKAYIISTRADGRHNYPRLWFSLCVILSVCAQDKTKTAETKISKIGTGIVQHDTLGHFIFR